MVPSERIKAALIKNKCKLHYDENDVLICVEDQFGGDLMVVEDGNIITAALYFVDDFGEHIDGIYAGSDRENHYYNVLGDLRAALAGV